MSEDRVARLLREGQAAARAGRRARARGKFRTTLIFDPVNVTALLWLAWLNDNPRASLAYIARVMASDPHSRRAHAALHWARQRVNAPVPSRSVYSPFVARSPSRRRWLRHGVVAAFLILAAVIGGALAGSLVSNLPALAALDVTPFPSATPAGVAMATATTSSKATGTNAPSHTATPTAMRSPTPTSSPAPVDTPTPARTATAGSPPPMPTAPPLPPINTPVLPPPDSQVRWIDVDLTNQTLTAYVGRTAVRTTLISTGRSRTPTPAGMFRIYVKLRYDDMSGPGYYLRDVPYTMYFYRGYGLHGTYWHSNFGRQMSHGCVNLPTREAKWLFNWAKVGTPVNIHH